MYTIITIIYLRLSMSDFQAILKTTKRSVLLVKSMAYTGLSDGDDQPARWWTWITAAVRAYLPSVPEFPGLSRKMWICICPGVPERLEIIPDLCSIQFDLQT